VKERAFELFRWVRPGKRALKLAVSFMRSCCAARMRRRISLHDTLAHGIPPFSSYVPEFFAHETRGMNDYPADGPLIRTGGADTGRTIDPAPVRSA
jgi:hypothetical protein